MSWLSALRSIFGLSKVAGSASSAAKATTTVAKAGKTIINATKGSKIIVQMGEAGASVAKAAGTVMQTSKIWIIAKWGLVSALVIGVGVALKNFMSGIFGSAHDGLSSVLESFGLSSEQADTGASIIFVALFVMIVIYAIQHFTNKDTEHKVTPVIKNTYTKVRTSAADDWNTLKSNGTEPKNEGYRNNGYNNNRYNNYNPNYYNKYNNQNRGGRR